MEARNHEFDWGVDNLLQNVDSVSFPVLAANVTRTIDGTLLLEDNHVFATSSGMKIGVFGLQTPETAEKTSPDNVEGLTFASGEEMYQCAQKQIDTLKQEGCTMIICLGHLGIDDVSEPNRSIDVINNTEGINVFIDAHSHSEVNETVNDTLLWQTGKYGHNLWKLMILTDGSTSDELLSVINQDETVAADTASWYKAFTKTLSKVTAASEVDLDGTQVSNRTVETNLADLIMDAVLYEAQINTTETIDASILNGATFSNSIPAGDVTLLQIGNVFTFEDNVVTFKVTDAEILEALESSCATLPESTTAFPQVSGIVYCVDTSVAFEQGEQYSGSKYYKPANPGAEWLSRV